MTPQRLMPIAMLLTLWVGAPVCAEDTPPPGTFTVEEFDIPAPVVRPILIQGGVERQLRSPFKVFVDTIFRDYPEQGGDMPGPGSWASVDSTLTTMGMDGSPLFSSNSNLQTLKPALIPQSRFPTKIGGFWKPHDMSQVEQLKSTGSPSLDRP
jgi:hypothetical protein